MINIPKEKKWTDVFIELFIPKNINHSTDVTLDHIRILCLDYLFYLIDKNNKKPIKEREDHNEIMKKVMEYYKELKISLNRESRKELASVIRRTPMLDDENFMERIKEQTKSLK